MAKIDTVVHLPKTAAQARRLKKLMRQDDPVEIAITILPGEDSFRVQRTWRLLFGLYQDCACIRWSRGFRKTPARPFHGLMRPSRLSLFLREAMPLVADRRAEIHIGGERVRRRLLDVLAA